MFNIFVTEKKDWRLELEKQGSVGQFLIIRANNKGFRDISGLKFNPENYGIKIQSQNFIFSGLNCN